MSRSDIVWLAMLLALVPPHARSDLVTSQASGDWDAGATWSTGTPPATNDDVVVAHTVTVYKKTEIPVNSLTVNGTLTHGNNSTSHAYALRITSATFITVNGAVNVSGKGYAGGDGTHTTGYGPGGGVQGNPAGGGGYGGEGGTTGGRGGTCYGSVSQPTHLGSGGGASQYYGWSNGGAGGGAVQLDADTVTVSGSILANGSNGTGGGGKATGAGAAGSIWINADTFAGNGLLQANGGAGVGSWSGDSGGGGGGKIAVYCATDSFAGTVQTLGGNSTRGTGGGGTYYKQCGRTASLVADNGRTGGMYGTAGTWTSNTILNSCDSVVVRNYGILKHPYQVPMEVDIRTFTIAAYGAVNVMGKGYAGGDGTHTTGYGPGGGVQGNPAGGGGYGGRGGTGSGAGGGTYGSTAQPTDMGSGGGASQYYGWSNGGAGGGALKITARYLTVDGSILADGANGYGNAAKATGAGSGGSVWLHATRLMGSGYLRAKGGDGAGSWSGTSGGGGGGRIAIYYTSLEFTGAVTVPAGTGGTGAQAGTIYWEYVPPRATIFELR